MSKPVDKNGVRWADFVWLHKHAAEKQSRVELHASPGEGLTLLRIKGKVTKSVHVTDNDLKAASKRLRRLLSQ